MRWEHYAHLRAGWSKSRSVKPTLVYSESGLLELSASGQEDQFQAGESNKASIEIEEEV